MIWRDLRGFPCACLQSRDVASASCMPPPFPTHTKTSWNVSCSHTRQESVLRSPAASQPCRPHRALQESRCLSFSGRSRLLLPATPHSSPRALAFPVPLSRSSALQAASLLFQTWMSTVKCQPLGQRLPPQARLSTAGAVTTPLSSTDYHPFSAGNVESASCLSSLRIRAHIP